MEAKKGTIRGHLRNMLRALFLWTTYVKPEKFKEEIEKVCFTFDKLTLEKKEEQENKIIHYLIFDFGDIEIAYFVTFTLSPTTKKWVVSAID